MILRHAFRWGTVATAILLCVTLASAQQGGRQRPGTKEEEPPPLPEDPRLRALHADFVLKAEKLAIEYDKTKQTDKARAVCEEILKLVPRYPTAVEMLNKIKAKEASAERLVIDIKADEGWQDTGIIVIEGKPVSLRAEGKWTFQMEYELGPDGLEIPKELRDFKLGSLIGFVDPGPTNPKDRDKYRPFHIGASHEFVAKESGRLLMRMHDGDPKDNRGRMTVEVNGTFQRAKK